VGEQRQQVWEAVVVTSEGEGFNWNLLLELLL
jgi:hypothetical protein